MDKAGIYLGFRAIVLSAMVLGMQANSTVVAQAVRFDLPAVIRVTNQQEQEGQVHAQSKLIVVDLELSTHFENASAAEVEELIVEILPANARHQIVDIGPKTRLESQIEGTITVEKHNESNTSAGIDLNGSYEKLIRGNTHLTRGSRNTDTLRYQQKPLKSTVVASGTIRRGTGALVKLRRSNEASMEGQHSIVVSWEVPFDWQGDLFQVRCAALRMEERIVGSPTKKVISRQTMIVPVVSSDPAVESLVSEFVKRDWEFRHAVSSWAPSGIDGWLENNLREIRDSAREVVSGKTQMPWQRSMFRLDSNVDKEFVEQNLPKSLHRDAIAWIKSRDRTLALSR